MQENTQEKSPIKQRILQYIEIKDISKYSFYKNTGITRGILDQKTGISEDSIARFIAYDKDINPDWLLTGRGEMLRSEKPHTYNNVDDIQTNIISDKWGKYVTNNPTRKSVPFYNIPISSLQCGAIDIGKENILPNGYIEMDIFNNCDAILPVTGVTMEPFIVNGDCIGIKRILVKDWKEIPTGRIYLIVTKNDRMIKFLKSAVDPQKIILSSPNYSDFFVKKQSIIEIYRVIAYIHSIN